VAKLMREAKILPKAIRRFRVTTDSRKTKASPNLINGDFMSKHPNDLWLSDITYIPTRQGWLYLAAVLDAYSRALVGWAMSRTLGTQLAMDALNMAIAHRGPPVTLHSDQGSTYATGSYREIVNRYGIKQSMSRKGRLLGQCAYGELLPYAEDRMGHALRLPDSRRCAGQPVRLHGSVLQPATTTLIDQLRGPATVRGDEIAW
jgi:transposase InsO family protein